MTRRREWRADAGLAELLEVLDCGVCMAIHELARAVAPPPLGANGRVDGRTRAGRAWAERMVDLFGASIELIDAGFAVVVAESDGRGRSTQLGITEAGRRYLAEMRALR
jgi:hypothetical protein